MHHSHLSLFPFISFYLFSYLSPSFHLSFLTFSLPPFFLAFVSVSPFSFYFNFLFSFFSRFFLPSFLPSISTFSLFFLPSLFIRFQQHFRLFINFPMFFILSSLVFLSINIYIFILGRKRTSAVVLKERRSKGCNAKAEVFYFRCLCVFGLCRLATRYVRQSTTAVKHVLKSNTTQVMCCVRRLILYKNYSLYGLTTIFCLLFIVFMCPIANNVFFRNSIRN